MHTKLCRPPGGLGSARIARVVGSAFRWLPTVYAALCLAAIVGAIPASPAFADPLDDKRVALVIGNGAYENAPKLDNATLDAMAVADAFRELGFQVVDGFDLDIAHMRVKVSEFAAALPDAKSAIIYYAGHGISVDEENYLIPTDIVLKSPTDLDLGSITVSLILRQMKREDRVNIVVLDACRDNPFAAALAKAKTRAIVGERGLSRIDGDLARGTLIAFASDPKSTALDGSPGHHSPFTEAFLAHVFDPGVSIDVVMSRVRTEVWEKTNHNQLPWVNTSLIGDYALNPQPSAEGAAIAKAADVPAPATSGGDRLSQEDLLWESAQHSNLSADYQAYLDAFPNGVFAQMAKNRIASLLAAPTNSTRDWKAEIGTLETEKSLNLAPPAEKEVQQRLTALDVYKGPATGALDSATRLAIAEWQKAAGVAPTSFLGPMQLAELRAESENAYEKALAAQAAAAPAERKAVRPATVKLPTRSAKAPEPAPKRHAVRKATSQTASGAAPAPQPADPGGTPAWRRKAGLPVDEPDRYGPPPPAQIMMGVGAGAAGGLLLGGFRHY